jgi:hypothetical protein
MHRSSDNMNKSSAQNLLMTLDRLVRQHGFPSRKRIIQQAVEEKVARIETNRLARGCEKPDLRFEQSLAEDREQELPGQASFFRFRLQFVVGGKKRRAPLLS